MPIIPSLLGHTKSMSGAFTVEPLARHRRLLPLIEGWFVGEWPAWYGPTGPGNAAQDREAFAASEAVLPVGLVALSRGIPIGVGALKAESIPTHTHLAPWAAAGFVVPAYRGQGMGAAILAALVTHARSLGFDRVYCGTSTAGSLLQRCGWSSLEVIQHAGKPLTIFRSTALHPCNALQR